MLPNQHWYCCLLAFFVLSTVAISSLLLVSMTFERFYSIMRPHKAASFNTVQKAKMTIICICIFSFTFHIPYLFVSGNDGRICIQNTVASENILGELYYWMSEIIGFFFPFLSILTMNSIIIHTLRQRSKQNASISEGQAQSQDVKSKNSERQVYTMLLFVTFGYLTLTMPVKSLVFYLNFYKGDTPVYYAGLHLFYQIGEKSYYTNNAINFFLYVMSGKKFRTDLKNLFTTHPGSCLFRGPSDQTVGP